MDISKLLLIRFKHNEFPRKVKGRGCNFARGNRSAKRAEWQFAWLCDNDFVQMLPTLLPSSAIASVQTKHLHSLTCGLPAPRRVESWLSDKTPTQSSFHKCFQVKKPFLLGWFQAYRCQDLNFPSHTAIYCLRPCALKTKKEGIIHRAFQESRALFMDALSRVPLEQ